MDKFNRKVERVYLQYEIDLRSSAAKTDRFIPPRPPNISALEFYSTKTHHH